MCCVLEHIAFASQDGRLCANTTHVNEIFLLDILKSVISYTKKKKKNILKHWRLFFFCVRFCYLVHHGQDIHRRYGSVCKFEQNIWSITKFQCVYLRFVTFIYLFFCDKHIFAREKDFLALQTNKNDDNNYLFVTCDAKLHDGLKIVSGSDTRSINFFVVVVYFVIRFWT